jgi:glycosyltransferase involved in cell wall biosynthesis
LEQVRAADPSSGCTACRIDEPYLLALAITLRRHQGGHWADPSWAKDLLRHCEYLSDLTLFCPVEDAQPGPGWVQVDRPGLRIAGYPVPQSWPGFLLRLPRWVARLSAEVRRARVVHSGIAGWPVPPGWIAAPLARRHGKLLVLIVESAFWRLRPGEPAGWRRRLNAWGWERAARACMARADYAAYTQPEWQRSLPAPRAGGGRLIQASWVDKADLIPDDGAADRRGERRSSLERGEPARFLFAARLVPEKGTGVIAEAIERLAMRDAPVTLDVIGEGPERDRIARAADTEWGRAHVRLLDPVPYDGNFLGRLAIYDALIVPSLSDEQPRIVYDGYSQGVPTIGSDRPGLAACVQDGVTGRLVPAGDAQALADALMAAATDPEPLMTWGGNGLRRVRGLTHQSLHAQRCHDLTALLDRN